MCAIRTDGTVRCAGGMQRRDAVSQPFYPVEYAIPAPVVGVERAIQIISIPPYFFATSESGRVWSWDGSLVARDYPAFFGATMLARNGPQLLARMGDGTVRCAGYNTQRECDDSGRASIAPDQPVTLEGVRDVVEVATAHSYAVYALRRDGTLLRRGRVRVNRAGQVGAQPTEPEVVASPTDVVRIRGGLGDLLAVRRDGSVWSIHLPTADGVPSVTRVPGFGPP